MPKPESKIPTAGFPETHLNPDAAKEPTQTPAPKGDKETEAGK